MSSRKYVIGTGPSLDWAMAHWAEAATEETLSRIDVGQDKDYRFDRSGLDALSPQGATAFVAWGPQFLNYRRLELMGELKGRGFRLPPLICRGAIIAQSAVIGENCAIGPGAVIGALCKLDFNAVIGCAAVIGHGCRVGASVWIEDGVQIGAGSIIGAHATLGSGVLLEAGIQVGKRCVVDVPRRYTASIANGTFHLPAFPSPVVILNG